MSVYKNRSVQLLKTRGAVALAVLLGIMAGMSGLPSPTRAAQAGGTPWNIDQINADDVWNMGYTGEGITVALLDTGIDQSHPDLGARIAETQECLQGTCQGGPALDDNGHGTSVAGIVASQGTSSPQGVAPGANLVVVKVLEGGGGRVEDTIAAIDWVVANQARLQVKVLNIGARFDLFAGACDNATPLTGDFAAAVERARQAGIVVFSNSGNGGETNMMQAPACIANVVAVASVGTSDQVSGFSNSSSALDLLAPGEGILSTAMGGGQAAFSGSSATSPHAAGVAALMLQANPQLSPAQIEAILKDSGVLVEDSRNGRVTPRIDALAAVNQALALLPPQPVAVNIMVDRGEGATYYVGEQLGLCYNVSRPIYVRIYDCPPGESCIIVAEGFDDGQGGCVEGTVAPPTGQEVLRIEAVENDQVLAESQTHFFVEAAPTSPPPPTDTLVPTNPPPAATDTVAPTSPPVEPTDTLAPTSPPAEPADTTAPTNPPAAPTVTLAAANAPAEPTVTLAPTNPPVAPAPEAEPSGGGLCGSSALIAGLVLAAGVVKTNRDRPRRPNLREKR
ncbi:MAG: S8 family serine peptidase [Anaerolineae bacterium]|jgi:subtilisin family serine protease